MDYQAPLRDSSTCVATATTSVSRHISAVSRDIPANDPVESGVV